MKGRLPILIFLVVFVVACSSQNEGDVVETRHDTSIPFVAFPELSAIDSLMWQCPDSELTCLLPYFDTCCRDVSRNVSETANDGISGDVSGNVSTDFNRHYAHLLLAELLYKNDYAQTNRAELRQAVGYYDSLLIADTRGVSLHGSNRRDASHASANTAAFLDARAHYINGVGYYEYDSVVEACEEYLKALEVMEEHFEEKELVGKKAKFMALTHSHLVGLFSDLYLHEQALYFGKLALAYYKKHDAQPWHIAWTIESIGNYHELLQNYDSAYFYYTQGRELLTDTSVLLYRDISTGLARLSIKMGGSPSTSLKQMRRILNSAENEQEYISRCFSIGSMFYDDKQFDSAWKYLKIVYDKAQEVDSKKGAAELLVKIGEAHGKSEEVSGFARFLVSFATIEENHNSATKSQLAEQYNTFRQSQLVRHQRSKEKKRERQSLYTIAGLSFIITLAIVTFRIRNKRQKQRLETQIEEERQSHQMQQTAWEEKLKQSVAATKEQSQSRDNEVPTITKNYDEEPICQQILDSCNDKSHPIKSTLPVSAYASIALSDLQKAELKNAAMRHYGILFDKLRHDFPELKEKDFIYCYLCLLGLDNTQIAVLLQKSLSTIWDRENRLKRVFHSDSKVSVTLLGFITN